MANIVLYSNTKTKPGYAWNYLRLVRIYFICDTCR